MAARLDTSNSQLGICDLIDRNWQFHPHGSKARTMTAKNTKAKPARRTKARATAQPQERTVTIRFPTRTTRTRPIAFWRKGFPVGTSSTRTSGVSCRADPRSSQARGTGEGEVDRKPDGGWIEPAGKSEVLDVLKLHQTFAANSLDPVNARASELIKYLNSVGACNEGRYNAALSFIESMEPQNQAEALLLVQIYVTHDAAIRALSQLGSAEWVPHMQTFGNLATKLLRTSQGQMEALARMRRGGEQVVRHVHVDNRGGQAVDCRKRPDRGEGK